VEPEIWICCFLPIFLAIAIAWMQQRQEYEFRMLKLWRKRKGKTIMSESLKRFIGKECSITVMSLGATVTGVVEAVEDNWLVVRGKKTPDQPEMVNVEFVSRICECKKKKAA